MNSIEQTISNPQQNIQKPSIDGKDNAASQVPYMAAGAGICYGIGKGVDLFVKSNNGYQKSILGKLVGKIDKLAENNKFAQAVENLLSSIGKRINGGITQIAKTPEGGKVVEVLKNGANAKSMLTHSNLITQLTERIAKEPQNAAAIANKIEILQNSKSLLSKFISKFTIGTGNFVGSGLTSIALMGVLFGNTIKTAMNAPKGEKLSTFMEDLMGGWIGGYLMFSPAGKVINAVAGLKNLATNPASPIWQKGLKLIGKVIGSGQGQGFSKGIASGLKGLPGGILRLALVIAITAPFTKLFKKISHMIFGKPTQNDKAVDKGNNENTLFDKLKNPSVQQNQIQSPNQSQNPTMNLTPGNPYTYMPSSAPAKFDNKESTSKLDNIMQRSEKAEKDALQILGK